MGDTSSNVSSGNDDVDSLLAARRWSGPTVTYGFPETAAQYGPYARPIFDGPFSRTLVDETAGFSPVPEGLRAYARAAFAEVAGSTGLDLVENAAAPGATTISLGVTTTPFPGSNGGARGIYPFSDTWGGDVWIDGSRPSALTQGAPQPGLGGEARRVLFHEIGHSLGLFHPHEGQSLGFKRMSPALDSPEFTLMTYRSFVGEPIDPANPTDARSLLGFNFPQSYMMYDIAALQHLYGADYTANAGDTAYSF